MSLLDFDSYEAPKKGTGGNVVFVRGKACPISFRPIGKLFRYESVYDATLKKNRKPAPGERGNVRFLVNGLDANGVVKAYDIGGTVVDAIKSSRANCLALGGNPDRFFTITSKGHGLETTYSATATADVQADLNTRQIPADKLLDLATVAASIVVDPNAKRDFGDGLDGIGMPV